MPFASGPPWHARLVPWLGLAALIVIADQATKILIERVFDFGDVRPVTSFFNLVLTYNKGAAFSFLADASGWQHHFLTAVALAGGLIVANVLVPPTK